LRKGKKRREEKRREEKRREETRREEKKREEKKIVEQTAWKVVKLFRKRKMKRKRTFSASSTRRS